MPNKQIVLIGDSCIDNYVWVRGKGNTVIEHLKAELKDAELHDLTNDGFTTEDCLKGAFRDKAVSSIEKHTNVIFCPLEDKGAIESIQKADIIVLCVGGNDIRGLIQQQDFKDLGVDFSRALITMQKNYLEIFGKIRELNPKTKIILMTQYYPSRVQKDCYKVYSTMNMLLKTAINQNNCKNADQMIQQIMAQAYGNIFLNLSIKDNNFIVADITSSLDPYDKANHETQIEPSVAGGRIISKILAYIVTTPLDSKYAYQFPKGVFEKEPMIRSAIIKKIPVNNWQPVSPAEIGRINILTSTVVLYHKLKLSLFKTTSQKNESKETPITIEEKLKTHQIPDDLKKYMDNFKKDNHVPKLVSCEELIQKLKDSLSTFEGNEDAFIFFQMAYSYAKEVTNLNSPQDPLFSPQDCLPLFLHSDLPKEKWPMFLDILEESRNQAVNNENTFLLTELITSIRTGSLTDEIRKKIYPIVESEQSKQSDSPRLMM